MDCLAHHHRPSSIAFWYMITSCFMAVLVVHQFMLAISESTVHRMQGHMYINDDHVDSFINDLAPA